MQLSVGYAKREAQCKACPVKVCKGSLRICVGPAKSRKNYHTQCFFHDLSQGGKDYATDLPNAQVFEGLAKLMPIDAQRIEAQVIEYNRKTKNNNSDPQQGTSDNKTTTKPAKLNLKIPDAVNPKVSIRMGNVLVNAIYVSSDEESEETNPSVRGGSTSKETESSDSTSPSQSTVSQSQKSVPVNVIVTADVNSALPGSSSNNAPGPSNGIQNKTEKPEKDAQPPQKRRKTDENEEVCSICLDPPVHPVKLPCQHIYCYLCAKGLVMTDRFLTPPACSLCRQQFNPAHLESSKVLQEASETLNSTPPLGVDTDDNDRWQWFYQGNKGWWRYERRNNEDLEKSYLQGEQSTQLLMCGKLYTIDFVRMEQYQSNFPQRKRHVKRDLRSSDCKGVAGLVKSSTKNI